MATWAYSYSSQREAEELSRIRELIREHKHYIQKNIHMSNNQSFEYIFQRKKKMNYTDVTVRVLQYRVLKYWLLRFIEFKREI